MPGRSIKPHLLAAAIAVACTASAGTSRRADAQASNSALGSDVVARVGDQVITVAEAQRRIAQVPPFQLRVFGATPEEIRKNFVELVLVRELLLAQGAGLEKVQDRPEVQERIRGVLRGAMLERLRAEASAAAPVSDEEARAYYEANRAKYNAPARIKIWRILVATRGEAEAIIAELKKSLTPKRWTELARERSLDKATNQRGGDLGFVAPDGATAEPEIRVDPRVVAAAAAVQDAELVGEPVAEGERFAVVWRRQGMRAVSRTFELEAPAIRKALAFQKVEGRAKELLATLRAQHVSHEDPELVELIDVTSTGDLQPVKRPGTLPSSRRHGASAPSPVPRPDMR